MTSVIPFPQDKSSPTHTAQMTLRDAIEIGDTLVKTGFMPEHVKTGAQAAAIILTGQELGMAPMRSLRSLVMVKGKVTESADSQLARFKSTGGRAEFTELTETRAVLTLRHPNGDVHTETFTIEDATRAEIAGAMYKKYPKAMLRSRVITAALKSLGWEGGTGIYDPSELVHDAPEGEVREARRSRRAAQAETVEARVVEDLTLEVAMGMLLPGAPDAWGGRGGQPLSAISPKKLEAVGNWCLKQEETPNGYSDAKRLREACVLVLDHKRREAAAAGEVQPPAKKEKAAKADATPVGTSIDGPGVRPEDDF